MIKNLKETRMVKDGENHSNTDLTYDRLSFSKFRLSHWLVINQKHLICVLKKMF